jgi:Transposase IS116/IS110/IS902 family
VLIDLVRRQLSADAGRDQAVRHAEIRRLARALRQARRQLKANHDELLTIVDAIACGSNRPVWCRTGQRRVSRGQLLPPRPLPGWEAAFAALAGTNPPASSGRIVRHRLNRGGDRALNCASHTIALSRIRGCPHTRADIERRTAQGKTPAAGQPCACRKPHPPW